VTLRQYVPLSLAVFVLVFAATRIFNVPFSPFAMILLFGETLLGFQVEDHRVQRFFKNIFGRS
jgi:hypothetical protein